MCKYVDFYVFTTKFHGNPKVYPYFQLKKDGSEVAILAASCLEELWNYFLDSFVIVKSDFVY